MNSSKYHATSDFRDVALNKVPKFVFDFFDGGSGNEEAVKSNIDEFKRVKLIPHIRDVSVAADIACTLFGEKYSAPFGIAPLGLCGLVNRNAEIILAQAAAKYQIPYVVSASSNKPIAEIANACGVPPWFQLYIPKVESHLEGLLQKAEYSGCPVLVVTVDAATAGKRLRDLRNGLKLPYKIHISNIVDAVKHPGWLIGQQRNGKLSFPNYESLVSDNDALTFSEMMSLQVGGNLDWSVIDKLRLRWKNKMVLKGVLSTIDAKRAAEIGVDGVIVSNHGGRQLNAAPAPISVLPKFSACGFGKEFLMMDSGIRSGEDIIASLASGAGFTFMGRALLYALAANAESGVDRFLQIIFEELRSSMKLVGANSLNDLGRRNVFDCGS